jgi:hypothetical protein
LHVYRLDSSEPDRWDELVLQPAQAALEALLAGQNARVKAVKGAPCLLFAC